MFSGASIFNYSIKQNLLWANPKADESKIWNVLELAMQMIL